MRTYRTYPQYPVVVFSKNYCPHCKRAIEILGLEGVHQNNNDNNNDNSEKEVLHVIDLMAYENFSDIQDALEQMTRRRTVPNVFVGGRSLGGTAELENLQLNGKLHGYLGRARAIPSSRTKSI